jgi:hypothetical protein
MDPTLSLAFGMHSNPGVYALLLGSGVSRSAAIPTGWEIVLDLIGKLAAMVGDADACAADPEGWFVTKFGEAPDYGEVLKKVAPRPAERQRLLRSYFEASSAEEAAGQKRPTAAHKAIADLAKSGHVRLIVTTNFDRLLERSLEAIGVSPTVVSTADAAAGAPPLAHASCTVIKLHGDYLDTRIKNSPDELASYALGTRRLLDRILDEFGLVVCGWSADWDEALRNAIMRCKTRRFTTYWAVRGDPSDAATRLIAQRDARTITIEGADRFFVGLRDKVLAIQATGAPHPLSARTAVATVKRLLADEQRYRIELHDLVSSEVERVIGATDPERMPMNGDTSPEGLRSRVQRYEAATVILASVVATGCYWGGSQGRLLWSETLARLARLPMVGGTNLLINLRRYPATLVFYAGGIAALRAMNMLSLKALLATPVHDEEREASPTWERLCARRLDDVTRSLFTDERYTPSSDHLLQALRKPLRDLIPADDEYNQAFDKFEYFLALVAVDRELGDLSKGARAPLGRFAWQGRALGVAPIIASVEREVTAAGDGWQPIAAGLFTSIERFGQVAAEVAKNVANRGWSR